MDASEFDRDYGSVSKLVENGIVSDLSELTPSEIAGSSSKLDQVLHVGANAARISAGSGMNAREVRGRMGVAIAAKAAEFTAAASAAPDKATEHRLTFAANMLTAFQNEVASHYDGVPVVSTIRNVAEQHAVYGPSGGADPAARGLAKSFHESLSDMPDPSATTGESAKWSPLTNIDTVMSGFDNYASVVRSPSPVVADPRNELMDSVSTVKTTVGGRT